MTRVLCIALVVFAASCTSKPETHQSQKKEESAGIERGHVNCQEITRQAVRMDSTLMVQTEMDTGAANKAIKAFTDYVWYCGNDSTSPVYLIKTAQVARAINNIPQSKLALEKCINDYPSFTNRPAALFLMGQLYDEAGYLNDEHEARKYYQKIIDEYPKSEWVSSAKAAISYLGKSDEEILRELKKKEKSKS